MIKNQFKENMENLKSFFEKSVDGYGDANDFEKKALKAVILAGVSTGSVVFEYIAETKTGEKLNDFYAFLTENYGILAQYVGTYYTDPKSDVNRYILAHNIDFKTEWVGLSKEEQEKINSNINDYLSKIYHEQIKELLTMIRKENFDEFDLEDIENAKKEMMIGMSDVMNTEKGKAVIAELENKIDEAMNDLQSSSLKI